MLNVNIIFFVLNFTQQFFNEIFSFCVAAASISNIKQRLCIFINFCLVIFDIQDIRSVKAEDS